MKGFKEIADKCLKKELSGHFILKSGGTIYSNRLQESGFYRFSQWQYAYNDLGKCINGKPEWDIIKFIPNSNMKNDKRNV